MLAICALYTHVDRQAGRVGMVDFATFRRTQCAATSQPAEMSALPETYS
jgi:hypothetical protein